MRIRRKYFIGTLLFSRVLAVCPLDWVLRAEDDTCYRAWPTPTDTFRGTATYEEAKTFCRSQLPQIVPSLAPRVMHVFPDQSLVDFILNDENMGLKNSGVSFWIDVRADRKVRVNSASDVKWFTGNGRELSVSNPPLATFLDMNEPSSTRLDDCLAMSLAPSGNNKIISIDCRNRISVVCMHPNTFALTSLLVDAKTLNSAREITARPVSFTHLRGSQQQILIVGTRIPEATKVLLQTTSGAGGSQPNLPSNCIGQSRQHVNTLSGGPSEPMPIACKGSSSNGFCDAQGAVLTISASHSSLLSFDARYSLCFFIPINYALNPLLVAEFENLLPGTSLHVQQSNDDFLKESCKTHQKAVEPFPNI